MNGARLLLAVLLLGGCSSSSGPSADRLDGDALYQRTRAARTSGKCAQMVGTDAGQSLPVPLRGKDSFAVFFYPWQQAPDGFRVSAPLHEAILDAEGGVECRKARAGPAARDNGTVQLKADEETEARLFEAMRQSAAAYWEGTVGNRKQSIDALPALFLKTAEAPLLQDYYRLNPDFWEWLRKETGTSLPRS